MPQITITLDIEEDGSGMDVTFDNSEKTEEHHVNAGGSLSAIICHAIKLELYLPDPNEKVLLN